MSTLKLKRDFHKLIDSIDNEQLLSAFYALLKRKAENEEGKLWQNLTAEQRNALKNAFQESEHAENLVGHDTVRKKFKKWL